MMITRALLFVAGAMLTLQLSAQQHDNINLGNKHSEAKHRFEGTMTESYRGGLGESARRMLPPKTMDYRGGVLAFKMKVKPEGQNYFTVRCFGSETDNSIMMLFCEGLQVGYRHLGDIDLLWRGNGFEPYLGRFFYTTLPLPLKLTEGKSEVSIQIRSYGPMWDYGETFDKYQKPMTESTIGIYNAYTHTQPMFSPDNAEKQGVAPAPKLRTEPGIEILDRLKTRVNSELNTILAKTTPLTQLEMWFLADAYSIKWTPAFSNNRMLEKIATSIDDFYDRYRQDTTLVYMDEQVYNWEWLTVGPIARTIRKLWIPMGGTLTATRRAQWSELMQASLRYSLAHRRQYTNQSMIIDMFMYDVNKTLTLLDPNAALPEYQTLKYLHESMGLTPWLGNETATGSEMPLGDKYMQLTAHGLTKELGYVGYYGEVLDWVVDLYRSTCVADQHETGDGKIREQLLKMMQARSYFRYPTTDEQGYTAMRIEAVVGWRDAGHYPGNVIYGDRGIAWDATPLMTAAVTLDPRAIGAAQQMIKDNQLFEIIEQKMALGGIRVTKSLLNIPDEYELIMSQPESSYSLPMNQSMPDFVFSDEEVGVVAVKNGDEILYASLYWRARNAVNNLAKVHYITPTIDRIANICIESEFDDSGMKYTRENWVNLGFAPWREWYDGINSAHAGEVLPIARIPAGTKFKPGDESVYAGRCLFYQMTYGKYIVAMNSSTDKRYTLKVPSAKSVKNLSSGTTATSGQTIEIAPMSTVVLYVEQ